MKQEIFEDPFGIDEWDRTAGQSLLRAHGQLTGVGSDHRREASHTPADREDLYGQWTALVRLLRGGKQSARRRRGAQAPRRTTRKHPADQLYIGVRAWFLEIIRTDCPQVLDNRWTEVFPPSRAALPQTAAVTLLRQMNKMIVASSRGRITSGGGIGYDVAADSAGIWATSSQISRMMACAFYLFIRAHRT